MLRSVNIRSRGPVSIRCRSPIRLCFLHNMVLEPRFRLQGLHRPRRRRPPAIRSLLLLSSTLMCPCSCACTLLHDAAATTPLLVLWATLAVGCQPLPFSGLCWAAPALLLLLLGYIFPCWAAPVRPCWIAPFGPRWALFASER